MVKINVLGNDRSKPPETSSGRALTAWYLARALGADGPLDVPETCDIAVAVDDPSLLGTVEAKRYYLWVTTTAVDLRAVRRWVGNGRGKIVVAASERVKAHARRVGLSVRCIVPLGACGTFAAAAARDPDLRRNVYLADDEWGAATVRGIEAFGVAHERVAGLRLTVLGTGERSPELVEALRRLPDDAVTVAEAPLAHSAMPAAVGGQGILVHLPIGAERGLAVREALVAGRAVVSNTTGVLGSVILGTGHGTDVKEAGMQIARLARSDDAFLSACDRNKRQGKRLGLAWSAVGARWRAMF